MRLSVKIVGGSECECEASPDSSVESLKRDVEVKLQLGKETEQKLLFRGKALQDGTSLSDYKLTDGSKLNLVVKRRENNIASLPSTTNSTETNVVSSKPSSSPSTAQKPIAPNSARQMSSSNGKSQSSKPQTLDDELRRVLRPYFNTATDTQKVVTAFKQIFHQRLSSMSLDDIERLARIYNSTNTLRF